MLFAHQRPGTQNKSITFKFDYKTLSIISDAACIQKYNSPWKYLLLNAMTACKASKRPCFGHKSLMGTLD